MEISFFLEEQIVRRAQWTAASMGKTLEGLLLNEIERLSKIAPDAPPTENPENRPGVGSVIMRRTLREDTYRIDWVRCKGALAEISDP
jgi:hypothetical protein